MNQPTDDQAIAHLINDLAAAIDDADGNAIESLMANATFTLDAFPAVVGGEAYRRLIEQGMILHDGSPRTQHLITNLVIDADSVAGRAESRCYITVLQQVGDGPLQVVLSGRYADSFTRDKGTWHFAARHMTVVLRGDTSQHSVHQM